MLMNRAQIVPAGRVRTQYTDRIKKSESNFTDSSYLPRTYRAQITPDCGSKTVLFTDRETWQKRSNNFCLQKHSLLCSVLNLYALCKYMQISGSVVSAQSFRLGFPKIIQALVSDFQTRDSASLIYHKVKPVSSVKIQTAEYPAMHLDLIKQWHKIPCP